MFQRTLLAACIIAASQSAFAASQDINLTATVNGSCTISDSETPSAINQALTILPNGKSDTTPVSLSFPVSCNAPSTLQMTSSNTGLTGPSAVSGYVNKIGYIASTSGVFSPFTLNVPLGAPQPPVQTMQPASGTLSLTVTPDGAGPLVKGAYSDTIHLVISPLQ